LYSSVDPTSKLARFRTNLKRIEQAEKAFKAAAKQDLIEAKQALRWVRANPGEPLPTHLALHRTRFLLVPSLRDEYIELAEYLFDGDPTFNIGQI
jgi:hypothetical protein